MKTKDGEYVKRKGKWLKVPDEIKEWRKAREGKNATVRDRRESPAHLNGETRSGKGLRGRG